MMVKSSKKIHNMIVAYALKRCERGYIPIGNLCRNYLGKYAFRFTAAIDL